MNEDFLAYAWAYRLFSAEPLKTTHDEELVILDPGRLNRNSGPDFENARIRIGRELWAGQVEIHVKASDWYLHKHTHDPAYKNVILHVVFEPDKEIFIEGKHVLPTLDLSKYLKAEVYPQFLAWQKSKTWIPCENNLKQAHQMIWTSWKDRLVAERMEIKSEIAKASLERNRGDWKMVFYELLTMQFGFKVNQQAMSLLAEHLPWNLIHRLHGSIGSIEAILFGQAGWLEKEPHDIYQAALKMEYDFLRKKHRLKPLARVIWQTGKTRPGNFPCLRIAQLAALLNSQENLYQDLLHLANLSEAVSFFNVKASEYWETHIEFGKTGRKNHAELGPASRQSLMINLLPNFWYSYGRYTQNEDFISKVMDFLQLCDAEQNHITKRWNGLGSEMHHALDSQAMIHLFNEYCSKKRCLSCQVGLYLMKQT